MKRGRSICNTLKAIRIKIARDNGIAYAPRECHHDGDCKGTCLACEAEVRYIESELGLLRMAGRAVTIAGLSVGVSALTSCVGCDGKPVMGAVGQDYDTEIVTEGELPPIEDVPMEERNDTDMTKGTIKKPEPQPETRPPVVGNIDMSDTIDCAM